MVDEPQRAAEPGRGVGLYEIDIYLAVRGDRIKRRLHRWRCQGSGSAGDLRGQRQCAQNHARGGIPVLQQQFGKTREVADEGAGIRVELLLARDRQRDAIAAVAVEHVANRGNRGPVPRRVGTRARGTP